jgi:hypothetical protein
METILPNLPKQSYLFDLQGFTVGNMPKNHSTLSYLSYPSFFVYFLAKKVVDKIAILSTPPDPCTKRNITEKQGERGKNRQDQKPGNMGSKHPT